MALTVLFWGASGDGKTTAAVTAPGKKWFAEFDAGSFARATDGNPKINVEEFIVDRFPAPLSFFDDDDDDVWTDSTMVGASGRGPMQFIQPIKGFREQFKLIKAAYGKALRDPEITLCIIDPVTNLQDRFAKIVQQQIQESTDRKEWTPDLKPLEYRRPNELMLNFLTAPKALDKDLALIAHRKEIYGSDGRGTGVYTWDCSSRVVDNVDLVVQVKREQKTVFGYIDKTASGGYDIEGMAVENPTFERLKQLVNAANVLRQAEYPLPRKYDELISMAQVVNE